MTKKLFKNKLVTCLCTRVFINPYKLARADTQGPNFLKMSIIDAITSGTTVRCFTKRLLTLYYAVESPFIHEL